MGPAGTPAAGQLPETVIDSIMTASSELSARETWVPRNHGFIPVLVPRLIALMVGASRRLDPDGLAARMVRQNALRVLAYLEADVRLTLLLDLARRAPAVIDDLFAGPIDDPYEPYRYNIFASLGIFARHGLIREIFTPERIASVRQAMIRTEKGARGEDKGETAR
ncbi:hypothetical protein LAZ40_11750 [Cereibacter sphaeroides]|uniref:hypothetical protein n=1 Tax=Cereibacter sphaeroides TaxID=1063 RepID=UPI001F34A5F6|nr:hypothetical protein [Cereibacter sphaeroides]MCE6959693.1 hypothetical protein [Cereibacter sphaeroides]MCE6974446.1 hypothetical protein [Cereibacter sphaeroides]